MRAGLSAGGVSSSPPFSTLILKLTGFCNLDCSYCYMFNLADRTYGRVERLCPADTAVLAVRRLVEDARSAGRSTVHLVLHGGEPLLWPHGRFEVLFDAIAEMRSQGVEINVSLQTNGLVVPDRTADLLAGHDATIGISLDGPEEINDRRRVRHDGSGSYRQVVESVGRLLDRGFPPERLGFLSVVDPSLSPKEYFEWADGLPSRNVSLLWPIEYSWESPPWPAGEEEEYRRRPLYGSWMAEAFAQWWDRHVETIQVRQFLYTIARMMGLPRHSDSIGNDFVDMLVVNTDGGIEYPDYLRAHRDGGSRTRYSVHAHSLAEVRTEDPLFRDLLRLRTRLPAECAACRNEDVCGGGFLAGRSDSGGFAPNLRSVLCWDQMFYFDAVRERIAPYLAAMESAEAEVKCD